MALAACRGSARERDARVADSAGVSIITAPAADLIVPWTYGERFSLGGADTTRGVFAEFHPSFVATDAKGQLYVLDPVLNTVRVFDEAGEPLGQLGRRGRGPGEFAFPIGLAAGAHGSVGVLDAAQASIVRFDADRNVRPLMSILETRPVSGRFSLGESDELLIEQQIASAPGPDEFSPGARIHDRLDLVSSGDTHTLVRMPDVPGNLLKWPCGVTVSGQLPLFTPRLRWSGTPARVALVASSEYRVDVYEAGRLTRSIRRNVPPQAVSDVEAERSLTPRKIRTPSVSCELSPAEQVRQLGTAPTLPAIEGVALDSDGSIWVQRGRLADEAPTLDRFAPDGSYVGTHIGYALPLAFLPGGVVLIRGEDQDGNPVLTAWMPPPTKPLLRRPP